MYTLLIDTHDTKVLLILYKDGKIIKKIEEESKQSHSILTMPLLKKLLDEQNINTKDINDIIVVNGPGSFTGVRIGVTIAKTMSFCLNVPIRAISSLEVLVASLDKKCSKMVALNDRNGYFVGKFNENNQLLEDYVYISNQEYIEFKKNNEVFDNISEINYEKVYLMAINKVALNPHLVNPLYVKKIEVQK